MPATDYHGSSSSSSSSSSSVPFSSLGRSLLSIRRDNVTPSDSPTPLETDLDSFQRYVADLFLDLSNSSSSSSDDGETTPLLSLQWIRRLLDAFLLCQEQFRLAVLLSPHARPLLLRPPLDRLLSDSLDRSLKALDLCNAVRDGLHHLRLLLQPLRIALSALSQLSLPHLRRASRALADFTVASLDASPNDRPSSLRNRSFGRPASPHPAARLRSLSWSVSRSWSASKQLQAMASNLSAPRNNEIAATGGLAVPVFTMSSVLVFVMWTLVAAIPCQDRGLQAHFSVPRSFQWAAPVMSLHERVLEESKRKERRNASGLLREIHRIERCARQLTEAVESAAQASPMTEEAEAELLARARELEEVCCAVEEGLDPLERQVREAFHRIVRSRMEGLDCLGGGSGSGYH